MSWQIQPPLSPEEHRENILAFYTDNLHDLIRAGVHLAQVIELRAVNATMNGTNAAIDAGAAFERTARAVRRSIMLAEKLNGPDHQLSPLPETDGTGVDDRRPATLAPECTLPAKPGTDEPPRERLDHDRPERFPDLAATPETGEAPACRDPDDIPDAALDHLSIPDQIDAIRGDLGQPPGPAYAPPHAPSPPKRKKGRRPPG